MAGAASDRDKLKTRFLAAEEDELRMLVESTRTGALERAVAREVLRERGALPPEDDDHEADSLAAAAEPFRPVPSPDAPREAGSDARRIGLVLVGVGLLVTQGLRYLSREEERRDRWEETARAAQLAQSVVPAATAQLDPEVLEAIERGDPIAIDAQGRIVVPVAPAPAPASRPPTPAEAEAEALFEVRCLADPRDCLAAGAAFERGEGVRADPARALVFYGTACEGAVEEACERARALRERAP